MAGNTQPAKVTEKNLLIEFEKLKKEASQGDKKAVETYLRFLESFTKDERKIIDDFVTRYKNSNDIIVLEQFSDEEEDVIIPFIHFVMDLKKEEPEGEDQSKKKKAKKTEPEEKKYRLDLSTEKRYLNHRYFAQEQFYDKGAQKSKAAFFKNQKWILRLSVFVPVCIIILSLLQSILQNCITSWKENAPDWYHEISNLVTALCAAFVAYLSSNEKLYSMLKDWITKRSTCERLKTEYALYQGKSGKYNLKDDKVVDGHTKSERKFRQEVEGIIQDAREVLVAYGKGQTGSQDTNNIEQQN
jgi:hypothetical protein